MTRCKARTADNKPCSAKPKAGADYCFIHDPAQATARALARKKGGQFHRTPHAGNVEAIARSPRSIPDAMTILDYALEEILVLDNSLQRVRALVAIAAGYIDALKVSEIETQVRELLGILKVRETT
jgi:hypothetical protein